MPTMKKTSSRMISIALFFLVALVGRTSGVTDYLDVLALHDLYGAFNFPEQLTGWNSIGNDPCGESWKGISCFGSAVVSIRLSGLGIAGTLGHHLSGLHNLNSLDVSNNSIGDTIPSELPTSLTYLDLSANKFSGNIPFVFSAMTSLNYLNLSHNLLMGQIGNIFTDLKKLSILDLSFNNLAGDLPISFSSMSSLSVLNLQGNGLTGSVNFLVNLPLSDLNIENNQFSGYIPKEFDSIPNHRTAGNRFQNGYDDQMGHLTKVPLPRHTPPTAHDISYNQPNEFSAFKSFTPYGDSEYHNKRTIPGKLAGAVTAGIFVATCIMLAIIFQIRRCPNRKCEKGTRIDGFCDTLPITSDDELNTKYVRAHLSADSSKAPSLHQKMIRVRLGGRRNVRKGEKDTNAISYCLIDLQNATENFSRNNLLEEGPTGCLYMAKFPNNQVLAIKKVEMLPSLQEREQFLEIVSKLSQFRHPNIVNLVGYCAEHGQHLLVYEYIGSTNLHDVLHCFGNDKKVLTWDARLNIALGIARALEYLHISCLPSVTHGNVRASNVLLDDDLLPQLSDCGLALLRNARRQISSLLFYSSGYRAPESTMVGIYTEKGDVYSFGVIMLELLTGRKPKDSLLPKSEQHLVRWFGSQRQNSSALMGTVDPALRGVFPSSALLPFADIAAACVQTEPESRPQISEVVAALLHLLQNASPNSADASDDASFWSSGTALESSPL